MKRTVSGTIARDDISPDSIVAMQQRLTYQLFEEAEAEGLAMDWEIWNTTVCRNLYGDLTIQQSARIL